MVFDRPKSLNLFTGAKPGFNLNDFACYSYTGAISKILLLAKGIKSSFNRTFCSQTTAKTLTNSTMFSINPFYKDNKKRAPKTRLKILLYAGNTYGLI